MCLFAGLLGDYQHRQCILFYLMLSVFLFLETESNCVDEAYFKLKSTCHHTWPSLAIFICICKVWHFLSSLRIVEIMMLILAVTTIESQQQETVMMLCAC